MTAHTHTHTDDRLTVGCAACIDAAEQWRWDNAPLHEVTVMWMSRLQGRRVCWTTDTEVTVPAGATPDQVAEHHARPLALAAEDDLAVTGPDLDDDDFQYAVENMFVDGLLIGDPIAVDTPEPDQLDMFGGAV